MNKKVIFYFSIIFLAYGCGSSKNSNYAFGFGKYLQEESPCISIEFFKDNFELINNCTDDHLPRYRCCDTLAIGEYNVDLRRGLLELSSSPRISNNSIQFEVVEKELEKNKDSLVFVFNNPISLHNSYHKELIYYIQIFSVEENKEITTDEAMLSFERIKDIEYFSISVFPKSDIALSNLAVREIDLIPFYNVIDSKSNVFEINTPILDYEFLARMRLNQDYIKIIDSHELIWDEKKYVKEVIGAN